MDIQEQKRLLRQRMLSRRDGLEAACKSAWDAEMRDRLDALLTGRRARTVHTYLPMGSEPDFTSLIGELLSRGVRVVAPRTLPGRRLEHRLLTSLEMLEAGPFGTRHPAGAALCNGPYDVIIVPGLAFDDNGNRLGYGGGYYDTFLAGHARAWKVALCYPFQLVEALPAGPHDVPVNEIIRPG